MCGNPFLPLSVRNSVSVDRTCDFVQLWTSAFWVQYSFCKPHPAGGLLSSVTLR